MSGFRSPNPREPILSFEGTLPSLELDAAERDPKDMVCRGLMLLVERERHHASCKEA